MWEKSMIGSDKISGVGTGFATSASAPDLDIAGRRRILATLYSENQVIPDILDTIAHISNDEVFTPPVLVNRILDTLPSETWSNPDLKILDPACKTGVFLRECARRFMVGLEGSIPDRGERLEHIMRNMLHGLAISELTALMSRKTLYCSSDATRRFDPKKPENCYSAVIFDNPDGNIMFPEIGHHFDPVTDICSDCGVSRNQYDRAEDRESYAYPFLHVSLDEVFPGMKFDIILGNPPYQMNDGGYGASASPIYQKFVAKAKENDPALLCFVIPARWYAGGKGLDDFRNEMRTDRKISLLVDIPNSSDAFPGVEIKGGVCYFLRSRSHDGRTLTRSFGSGKVVSETKRDLSEFDVVLRREEAARILRKVQTRIKKDNLNTLEKFVSAQKPFGLRTNFKDFKRDMFPGAVNIYARGAVGWADPEKIVVNPDWVNRHKVITPMAADGSGSFPISVMGKPILALAPSICTETYLVVRVFDRIDEAERFSEYMRTRTFRFLVWLRKNTQHLTRDRFMFVPDLPMDRVWTDESLAEYFDLDENDVAFIESMIREMP